MWVLLFGWQYVHNRTCVLLPAFDVSHAQAVNKVNTHKRCVGLPKQPSYPHREGMIHCFHSLDMCSDVSPGPHL